METTLKYTNNLGTVCMTGGGKSGIRITAIEGLGPFESEYTALIYSGEDGQETTESRALARCITVSADIVGNNAQSLFRQVCEVFSKAGTLYVINDGVARSIKCNQVKVAEPSRVQRGYAIGVTVQLVADSPYFETENDIVVPLYRRTKLLSVPFSLPHAFGKTVMGGKCDVDGGYTVEPIITVNCRNALTESETLTITNTRTNAVITLNHKPTANEIITIDIRNRTVSSSVSGNILNELSDSCFIGDFVLLPGENELKAIAGSINSGFTADCVYRCKYREAQIV